MKVGLFFGTYNPVHIGHMAIASYMVEYTDMDRLWFVVSPHSPFKKRLSLLADHHRLEMVRRAINDDDRFRESDIEFRMPKPSFTIDTLTWLTEKHPDHEFVLIMGSDGLGRFSLGGLLGQKIFAGPEQTDGQCQEPPRGLHV